MSLPEKMSIGWKTFQEEISEGSFGAGELKKSEYKDICDFNEMIADMRFVTVGSSVILR